MLRFPPAVAAAVAGVLACAPAAAQLQRSFVASYGSDANACTLAAPCRTFAVAHDATMSGGEIIALNAAGYGPVEIKKSISIIANPGVHAGISVSSFYGVLVSGDNLTVRLRGLKINNVGDGTAGIVIGGWSNTTLSIEDCIANGFRTNGISASGSGHYLRIADTVVSNNEFNGIQIGDGTTADIVNTRALDNWAAGISASANADVARVSVTRSVASGNREGFRANVVNSQGGVARMTVSDSTADHSWGTGFLALTEFAGTTAILSIAGSRATRNHVGFRTSGGGTSIIQSAGNNAVQENDLETSGTITNIGTM